MDNGSRDVIIHAPAAIATTPKAPTPDEILTWQAARIRELEQESSERTMAATSIANVAICLLRRLVDLGQSKDGAVVIPKAEEWRTRGMQLTIRELANGDVEARIRDQEKPAPVAYEDRRDG
jgi:hypothetical protein